MERQKNFFDAVGGIIPGYTDYVKRDDRRTADQHLRDKIAQALQHIEERIAGFQQTLPGDPTKMMQWETCRKAIDTLASKVKYAPYGESAYFSAQQIKEPELMQIADMDGKISAQVDSFLQNIITKPESELTSDTTMLQVKAVANMLEQRNQFIANFK